MSNSIEMAEMGQVKNSSDGDNVAVPATVQRPVPKTWRYKPWKLFCLIPMPPFASPEVQLFLVAMVCFLNPGLYNALSGLGGAGQIDSEAFDIAQCALYSTFAIVAFNSGSVANRLGLRLTLTLGALGYAVFAASFLCYNHTQNLGFVLAAGIFLGFSAGLLWTAQGVIMMCYPSESSRGKCISWFWSIFNLGAVIGAIVPLAANAKTDRAAPVNDATYIIFIVLMSTGGFFAYLSCNSNEVVRSDGTWVDMPKEPTWKTEIIWLWYTFLTYPFVVLLFPMFFASNFFYTYQFNGINQAHFNTRTRALNNLLYWLCQIGGAFAFGYAIDSTHFRRSVKAKLAWIVLLVLTMAVWGGGLAWQLRVPDRQNNQSPHLPTMDWKSPGYRQAMVLYMAYGFYDAVWQSCVYWFMGALSHSCRTSANFAGFYKGIQSAGAAIMWRLDGLGKPFLKEFLSNWIVLAVALLFAFPVFFWKITDYVSEEEIVEDAIGNATVNVGTIANPAHSSATAEALTINTQSGHSHGNNLAEPQSHSCGRLEPRNEARLFYGALQSPKTDSMMTLCEAVILTAPEAVAQEARGATV